MPGPLSDPNRRRRNTPTIPTTALPADGFRGRVPRCPTPLGPAGRAWWKWAWRTPQAAAWSAGGLYALAHRASLEDDLAARDGAASIDLTDLLVGPDAADAADALKAMVASLASLATGRVSILREIRELDTAFGLTAKGMAALRWTIKAPEKAGGKAAEVVTSDRWANLQVVDSA